MARYKAKTKKYPTRLTVKVEDLDEAVDNILTIYSHNVTELVKEASDTVADEALNKVKDLAPVQTGDYKNAWVWDNVFDSALERRNALHVEAPHYRLTHLLEWGHVIRNKRNGESYGRTREFPHVMPTYEYAMERYTKLVLEAIKDAAD